MKNNKISTSVIGCAFFVLTGCVSVDRPDYPPEWSQLHSVDKSTCADLDGTFENAGQKMGTNGHVNLTMLLFPKDDKEARTTALTVAIESSGGILEAVATLPDGTTHRSQLYETAKCTQRERYIKSVNSPGGVGSDGIAGVIHSSLELFRADDGSLVVRGTERDFVIALMIPVASERKSWYRFAQKVPTTP